MTPPDGAERRRALVLLLVVSGAVHLLTANQLSKLAFRVQMSDYATIARVAAVCAALAAASLATATWVALGWPYSRLRGLALLSATLLFGVGAWLLFVLGAATRW